MWETSCPLGLFPLSSFPYWKCSFCGNVGNQLAGATGSEHLGCYTLACSSEAQMRMEKERERERERKYILNMVSGFRLRCKDTWCPSTLA